MAYAGPVAGVLQITDRCSCDQVRIFKLVQRKSYIYSNAFDSDYERRLW